MRYQNLKSFQKHLASAAPHNLCRVYLVLIPDDYERAKALDAILSYVLSPDSLPTRFGGADAPLNEVLDALQTASLLGGDPVVVLDELEKMGKKTAQTLADFLSQTTPFGFLLLGCRGKTPLSSAVEKLGVVLDLADEKPWDKEKRLADFLADQAKNAGKRLSSDAAQLLFERLEKDAALLESELNKLISYTGDRPTIEREDVLKISSANASHTVWQTAEEIVWERGTLSLAEKDLFHAILPALRSQLELGFKIATLIESKTPSDQWSRYLTKVWPKTLEKRSSQAARLGSAYFRKGLDKLFSIELLSRTDSSQYPVLLDLFRAELVTGLVNR